VGLCKSLDHVPSIKLSAARGLKELGKGDLVVLDWKDLLPGLTQAIQMDLVSGFIFYIILVVVVAFSILNTFLMAILERTREFGVLLAIGTTPGRLTKILLTESAMITAMGIAAGIIAGGLVTWYFQVHGIVISGATELMRQYGLPERMFPQLSVLSISIGPAVVMMITFVTALYPALKVRRLLPVAAMSAA
jgi:ABC-type lipoprotein release transport system permease subunit